MNETNRNNVINELRKSRKTFKTCSLDSNCNSDTCNKSIYTIKRSIWRFRLRP